MKKYLFVISLAFMSLETSTLLIADSIGADPQAQDKIKTIYDLLQKHHVEGLEGGVDAFKKQSILRFSGSFFSKEALSALLSDIGSLTHLKVFGLSNANLKTFPVELRKLTGLRILDLSGNELQELPADFRNLKDLEILILDSNDFKVLPQIILELRKLKRLSLKRSKITSLPDLTGRLRALEVLNIPKTLESDPNLKLLKNLKALFLYDADGNEVNKVKGKKNVQAYLNDLTKGNEEANQTNDLKALYAFLEKHKVPGLGNSRASLKTMKEIELKSKALTDLPSEFVLLESVEKLNLSGNQFATLPSELKEFKQLKELNLSLNAFQKFPFEKGNFPQLKTLDIEGNSLTEFPFDPEIFPSLEHLSLSQKLIEKADIKKSDMLFLSKLTSLSYGKTELKGQQAIQKHLKLIATLQEIVNFLKPLGTVNKMSSRRPPGEIMTSIAVQDLNGLGINSPLLTSVPAALGTRLLDWLKLGPGTAVIPEGIGQLKSLQNLHVFQNTVSTIPEEVRHLTGLTILEIAGTSVQAIPAFIGRFQNLEKLLLNHNKLQSLPPEIGKLTTLKILSIQGNPLTDLPSEFSQLQGLEVLDLPQSLEKHPALKALNNLKELVLFNDQGKAVKTLKGSQAIKDYLTNLG